MKPSKAFQAAAMMLAVVRSATALPSGPQPATTSAALAEARTTTIQADIRPPLRGHFLDEHAHSSSPLKMATTPASESIIQNSTIATPLPAPSPAKHAKRDGPFSPVGDFLFGSSSSSSSSIADLITRTCAGKLYTKTYTHALSFTLAHPNDTLPPHHVPTFFIWTRWKASYPTVLTKAILNDATNTTQCPLGHCSSTAIPGPRGEQLRLVLSPIDKNSIAENPYWCYYVAQESVWRKGVQLGKASHWAPALLAHRLGFTEDDPEAEMVVSAVDAYIKERMAETYPGLEIGLLVGFTVGLAPGVVILACLGVLCVACCGFCVDGMVDPSEGEDFGQQRPRNRGNERNERNERSGGRIADVRGGNGEGVELRDVGSRPPSYKSTVRDRASNRELGKMV